MIYSIAQSILCTLVVYFDGSLRVPKDPNPGFGSSGIRRVASCAVTFMNDEEDKILAMCGKTIPLKIGITSADVEYEGLNFALDTLLHCLNDSCSQASEMIIKEIGPTVRVRGDCKTVMDHLNNAAVPRKQRDFFDGSKATIDQILSVYSATSSQPLTFEYEHVLREKNAISDHMCKYIGSLLQMKILQYLTDSIDRAEEYATISDMKYVLPTSKSKRLIYSKSHFCTPLNLLSDASGIIPYSQRPYFLIQLGNAAMNTKDFPAIRMIGKAIQHESSRSNLNQVVVRDATYEITLNHIGVLLEIDALNGLGLKREAMKIGKYLPCSRFDAINISDLLSRIEILPSLNSQQEKYTLTLSEGPESINDCRLKKWNPVISKWYEFICERERNVMLLTKIDDNDYSELSIDGTLYLPS